MENKMNAEIQRILGSSYFWDEELGGELYYRGNPLHDHWQTETERKAIETARKIVNKSCNPPVNSLI